MESEGPATSTSTPAAQPKPPTPDSDDEPLPSWIRRHHPDMVSQAQGLPAPPVSSPSREPGPGQPSAVAGSRVVTINGSAVRRALCQGAARGTLLGVSWLQPGERSFLDTMSQEQVVDRLLAWEIMCPGEAVEHGKLGGRLLRDCALDGVLQSYVADSAASRCASFRADR